MFLYFWLFHKTDATCHSRDCMLRNLPESTKRWLPPKAPPLIPAPIHHPSALLINRLTNRLIHSPHDLRFHVRRT